MHEKYGDGTRSLHRAALGGDSKPPPEPRARGPRSERDVANDVVFGAALSAHSIGMYWNILDPRHTPSNNIQHMDTYLNLLVTICMSLAQVVAVDLLFNHDRLDEEVWYVTMRRLNRSAHCSSMLRSQSFCSTENEEDINCTALTSQYRCVPTF